MLELRGGDHARWNRDGIIYRLAFPVVKKTQNLVISRRIRAGKAKKCTKKRGLLTTHVTMGVYDSIKGVYGCI